MTDESSKKDDNNESITLEDLFKEFKQFNEKFEKLEDSINSVQSEVRARYYDMENISFSNNNISRPGRINTSAAAGRSPRKGINSSHTYSVYS